MRIDLYTLNEEKIDTIYSKKDLRAEEQIPDNFTGIAVHLEDEYYMYLNLNDGFLLKYWFKNGKIHREDGPAIVVGKNTQYYIINNKHVLKEQHALFVDLMKLKGVEC